MWLLVGLLAAEFGIIWKENHGGLFEIRQCSCILANVDFPEMYVQNLEFEQESADGRDIGSSHVSFKPPGAMPTQFSIAFAVSTKPIRVYLHSRLTLGTWG